MKSGIINVYKEAGFTSFDVVAKLRGILKMRKIGHTGTLDPMAVGVLPVCLGNGTKLCDMLTDRSKTYEAVMLLGKATDTEDTSGEVVKETPVNVTEEEVCNVINSYIGEYDQIPPMYSALKVDGKKLYELARAGKTIERKARRVIINSIEILAVNLPYVTMRVDCGKGTYIRSLCRDIGESLGICACMDKLTRTRVGSFDIEDSLTLSDIEMLVQEGKVEQNIVSLTDVLAEYPLLNVNPEYKKKIDNGNPLATDMFNEDISPTADDIYRINNAEGQFFALYRYDEATDRMMPHKIFPLEV